MSFNGTLAKLKLSHGEYEMESDAKLAHEPFQELFKEEKWGDVEVYQGSSAESGLLISSSSALKDLKGDDLEAAEGSITLELYDLGYETVEIKIQSDVQDSEVEALKQSSKKVTI